MGKARPHYQPDPWSIPEQRKTIVLELLRERGDMTREQIQRWLDWPKWVWGSATADPLLQLELEGRVGRDKHGHGSRNTIWHADPDLTEILKENDARPPLHQGPTDPSGLRPDRGREEDDGPRQL